MKKIYSLLVAAAMVMGATSCQKDAAEEVAVNEPVSFTATLNATRTELGEGNKVMWNADDAIRVYTQDNLAGASFAGATTEATATTTFTTTEEFAASESGYFAVYTDKPYYELAANGWQYNWVAKEATYNNGVWSVPVKMQGAQYEGLYLPANTFVEENNFMVAYSEDNKLSFKPATAILKFVHTGAETWGSFRATGTDLIGPATLNYDTATGEISYTTEGTETYIDFEVTEAGQTCYIPIYPGTVSGFELYDDQTLIAKYDGEFTFKAGVIYNMDIENMPALPETSPYAVMVCNEGYFYGGDTYAMEIDGDYHVAKNVPFDETGYGIFTGTERWSFVSYSVAAEGNVALNTWTSVGEYMGYNINFECDMVDIYFSPENLMMCVVAAGEAVPAMPSKYHIYVYNSSAWDVVNLYVWDDYGTNSNGGWPGTALTKTMVGEVEYYVYDIPNEYIGQNINFIINNGSAQTADLYTVVENDVYYYTNGTVVEDPANPVIPEAANTVLYLVPNSNWKVDNARFAAYFFGAGETWVDMTDEDGDGYYECVAPEGYPNVIFCRMNPSATDNIWDNKWNQTADLTVPTDGTNCYTVAEGAWDKGDGSWSTK